MIIIVEGPVGSNTSATARLINEYLSKHDDTHTVMHVDHPELDDNSRAKLYFSSLTAALTYDKHVVIDNAWNFVDLPTAYKRMLSRAALSRSAIVVKCLPSMDSCIENSHVGTDETMKAYRQFELNATDFDAMPSFFYDHENDSIDDIIFYLRQLSTLNPYKGGGRFYKGNILVLCSKWRISKDIRRSAVVIPYINFNEIQGATQSASSLITMAFENGGIPEQDIYWVNVEDTAGNQLNPAIVDELQPSRIIAIGTQPRLWAMANNVQAEFVSQPNRTDTNLSLF